MRYLVGRASAQSLVGRHRDVLALSDTFPPSHLMLSDGPALSASRGLAADAYAKGGAFGSISQIPSALWDACGSWVHVWIAWSVVSRARCALVGRTHIGKFPFDARCLVALFRCVRVRVWFAGSLSEVP